MITCRFCRPVQLVLPMVFLVAALAAAEAADRQDMEISIGAGAWVPTGIDFDTELGAGPGFRAGIQIPMSLGNVIYLHAGYLSAGTNTPGYESVTCVPLVIGYRLFPLYRRYAGPRALEIFAGVYGGGMLAWDSVEGSGDNTTTGGGLAGLELGTRIYAGSSTFFDISFGFDYARAGGDLAGEDGDLSGFKIAGMISLVP